MAKLYFRYGAMNSGKTAHLLMTAHNYEELGMNVLVLKAAIDTKGLDEIVSRVGGKRKVDYLVSDSDDVYELVDKHDKEIHAVLVDEAQFLTANQVDQLLKITIKKDIPVLCYGLRTDFLTNGFAGSTRLLLVAHSIEELKTICKCKQKATFVVRMNDNEDVFEGNQVAIDGVGDTTYESVCPKCYYERKEKSLQKKLSINSNQ